MLKWLAKCWTEDKERRILWLPVLFGLGSGLYFSLPSEPSKWLTLGVIEALIVLAVIFRYSRLVLYVLGGMAIILAGFTVAQVKTLWLQSAPWNLPSETFYFRGKIVATDTNHQGRPRFVFQQIEDFSGKVYQGKFRVTQRPQKITAAVGDCVELIGTLNPVPTETHVGGYQFDRKAFFEGIKASGYAESRWFKIDCPLPENYSVSRWFYAQRQQILSYIDRVLPSSEASIVSAVVASEKGRISEHQYEQYRNAGLAHFLAISGLHMSMIAGLMFFLVRFLWALYPPLALRFDGKKVAAVVALFLSLVYLLISGQAVSAKRAFVMTSVVLVGVLCSRRALSLYSMALAAMLILFFSPEVLVSAGFQMSFAAVLGLTAFYEQVSVFLRRFLKTDRLYRWFKIVLLYIAGVIVADFIASVMTLPFAVYHFNMVAVYTSLGNFLAGPIIGLIIMPFVLLSLLTLPFGLAKPFLLVAGFGVDWVNRITQYVSSLPQAALWVPSMPTWGLITLSLGFLWLILWQSKWRNLGVIAIVIGWGSIFCASTPDILIAPQGRAIAFKNADGQLEFIQGKTNRFIKEVWCRRYPCAEAKTSLDNHPEVVLTEDGVTVNQQFYNWQDAIGLSVQYQNNKADIQTIRQNIGYRPWNNQPF
jgi:competence protein ComEC